MSEPRGPAPTSREDLAEEAKELLDTLNGDFKDIVYLARMMDTGAGMLQDAYNADEYFRKHTEPDSRSIRLLMDSHREACAIEAEMSIRLSGYGTKEVEGVSPLVRLCERLYAFLCGYTALVVKDRIDAENKKG